MNLDSESVRDETVLNIREPTCGICGPSIRDEEMIGWDGCLGWFHNRCVGVKDGKLAKKWYSQNRICQEKAQEYQKQEAKRQARKVKQIDVSDKSSVSSHVGAPNVETKLKLLEDQQKRQYEELEVQMRLWLALELQMRVEVEEQQRIWLQEVLQKKKEQLARMRTNQESFEKQMADLDREMAEFSGPKVQKSLSKINVGVSKAGASTKVDRNVLKLSKENVRKFAQDDESTEEEDNDAEDSEYTD